MRTLGSATGGHGQTRGPSVVARHLATMVLTSVVLGVLVTGLVLPLVAITQWGASRAARAVEELPESLVTQTLDQRSTIVDAQGRLVTHIYEYNRVVVSLDRVSNKARKAVVAIEDFRFYEHGALDVQGTLRALLSNVVGRGGRVEGGSSITQQLVKQTLLYQAETDAERARAVDQTYTRKLQELRYAIALEQEHSKDWILERYLNTVYFGNGAYGIEAAAERYFGARARDLNFTQAALLAGLVKNPTGYDPFSHRREARQRRDTVLGRLIDLGVVSKRRGETLMSRGLGLSPTPAPNGCVNATAPLFCQMVLGYLQRDPALGRTVRQRMHTVRTAGLTIESTLDSESQQSAQVAVEGHVSPTDSAIGALAMVEPGTGEVRAVAQSRPMGSDRGETYFNYAVNEEFGGANGFQAGSTFKVFVLAAALEQGIPLSTTYSSPATLTISESEFEDCDGQPYGYGSWTLSNSTTSGVKNLYSGTRESVNTFFALLTADTGLCQPFELARRMGVDLDNPTGAGAERIPSFTLGTADASPLEMAEAYATFAARGVHCASRPVTGLLDSNGNTVRTYAPDCGRVLRASTADAVNDVLRGVLEGGYASAQAIGQPAAGKTGNAESASVWFVGYTPTLAAAAMIAGANEQGSPVSLNGQTINGSYVSTVTGSSFAAPMWGDAMKPLAPRLPDEEFVYPSGVPGVGVTTVVAPTRAPEPARDRASSGDTTPQP